MTSLDPTAELPGRVPGRAAKIAAIHMLADWLASHPEVPMPIHVLATYRITAAEEPDQAIRYAAIADLAEELGVSEYGSHYGDRSPQFDYMVAAASVHGLDIEYRGSTESDQRAGAPL